MKICSPQLGISPHSHLGGAVHDRQVLAGLAGLGVEVEILLPGGEAFQLVPGWHIHTTARHRRYYYEYNWLFLPALRRAWQQTRFDLLRIHSPTLAPLGWLFHRLVGVPVVANYHHLDDDDPVHDRLNRLFIHSYDLVTTVSQSTAFQLAGRYGLPRERIQVIPNGVDKACRPLPPDAAMRASLGLEGKIVLLFLGALIERKNLSFLLEVLAQALPREPRLFLLIAGDGPLYADLQAEIRTRGLDGAARLVGAVSEEDKVRYLNLADIFVFPSLVEGFGMAVAEAMACGVPVLASRAAGLPEVVGMAGLLADPNEVRAFRSNLLTLAKDERLRRALGEAGRQRVHDHFSWDETARQTQTAYQAAIERHALKRRTPRLP